MRFWGVRGGIPTTGKSHRRFGGNTPCVEVHCGEYLLIFDAGTGIRPLGRALEERGSIDADIFFSESRFDHACGLPFFTCGFDPNNTFKVWAGHLGPNGSIEAELKAMMTSPLFPIPLSYIAGLNAWVDFAAGETLHPRPGITVRTAKLNHPSGATGYRVEHDGRALCYVNNTAHVPGRPDQTVLDLIRDADLVIYDSFYLDEEYPTNGVVGHSTSQEGVRLSLAAGAKRLAAFQHHPDHDDKTLKRVERALDKQLRGSFVAREGQTLKL